MSDDDENQPPPPPLPPELPETRMEAPIRNAMEAIERLAAIQASQMVAGGSPSRDIQSVVEIVRDSKDPSVIKSLNDNNYTALETGWIGDSRHYHHTKSKTAEKKIKRASANKRPESLGRPGGRRAVLPSTFA